MTMTCNQLIAERWQLGHFIFHSRIFVPQSWQYQITLHLYLNKSLFLIAAQSLYGSSARRSRLNVLGSNSDMHLIRLIDMTKDTQKGAQASYNGCPNSQP
jgi:hypothetical protein